jgi:hypothetical protein
VVTDSWLLAGVIICSTLAWSHMQMWLYDVVVVAGIIIGG